MNSGQNKREFILLLPSTNKNTHLFDNGSLTTKPHRAIGALDIFLRRNLCFFTVVEGKMMAKCLDALPPLKTKLLC